MTLPALPGHSSPRRTRRFAVVAGVVFLVAGLASGLLDRRTVEAGDAPGGTTPTETGVPPRWTPEILDVARTIPIQDEGRVKPLDTYAQFTLLRLNHRRDTADLEGARLQPIEWLLDVLFRPERARKYRCFSIENDAVLDAVGLAHEGRKKRDRYSFEELAPGLDAARSLAGALQGKSSKELSAEENGVVALAHDLGTFDALLHFGDVGRVSLPVEGSGALKALFPDRPAVTVVDLIGKAKELRALAGAARDAHAAHGGGGGDGAGAAVDAAAEKLLDAALAYAHSARFLAIVPPPVPRDQEKEWLAPGDVFRGMLLGGAVDVEYQKMAARFLGMVAASRDPGAFQTEIREFQKTTSEIAKRRGEYDKIRLEVFLYRLDPFYRALWFYGLAFLLFAFSWAATLASSGAAVAKWLRWIGWAPLLAAIALQVGGIVLRCVLLDRPPIKNLYDTVIFISAVGALAFVVAEWITAKGIALAAAPIFGAVTQFVGNRYEILKGEDTLHQLQAVLDTNFWLATHVTCITLGYCGGLLSAALGHVTVLGRATGFGSDGFYRSVNRLTYGMLGFGLFFSVIGTILGGVWADESWGRFWGWDPKENGALMICLAQLAILHGRMGGMLKPFGFAMANIVQGGVVAFSWWGVNLLGIGLHSYGFTGGVWTGLLIFYGIEVAVLGAGAVTWLLGRAYGARPPDAPPAVA